MPLQTLSKLNFKHDFWSSRRNSDDLRCNSNSEKHMQNITHCLQRRTVKSQGHAKISARCLHTALVCSSVLHHARRICKRDAQNFGFLWTSLVFEICTRLRVVSEPSLPPLLSSTIHSTPSYNRMCCRFEGLFEKRADTCASFLLCARVIAVDCLRVHGAIDIAFLQLHLNCLLSFHSSAVSFLRARAPIPLSCCRTKMDPRRMQKCMRGLLIAIMVLILGALPVCVWQMQQQSFEIQCAPLAESHAVLSSLSRAVSSHGSLLACSSCSRFRWR